MSDIKRFNAEEAVKLIQLAYDDAVARLQHDRDEILASVAQAGQAIVSLPERLETLAAKALVIETTDFEIKSSGHNADCDCNNCRPMLREASLGFSNLNSYPLVRQGQSWLEERATRTLFVAGKYRAFLFITKIEP